MMGFSDRLAQAIRDRKTPLIVGLDPRWEQLPPTLTEHVNPGDRSDIAGRFAKFCQDVIDVVSSLVPAIKPQWAFFEQLGWQGIAALEDVVAHARRRGLLVIADAKRGDVGSTAEAYAEAFFRRMGNVTFSDAVTVNPYLGLDALEPFVRRAKQDGGGLFVLVKTSNRGSSDFQDLRLDGGGESETLGHTTTLYNRVGDHVERLAAVCLGQCGYGNIGAVVGATFPDQLRQLRQRMPHAWFLVPGFGAQGGSARDVAGAFDDRGLGALINSSRAIIFAYNDPRFTSASDWQSAVEQACRDAIEQLRNETPAGELC